MTLTLTEGLKLKLPYGKIPIEILEKIVFKNLGAKREEVVLGPSIGFDGAVIDVGNKSLIVSMDPITGAKERIGWLAVNINANDVATFGVEPAFFSSCIMLPENIDEKTLETICIQMDRAAKDLGIAIVGGHCEATPGLSHPIVVGCIMGITEKGNYVTAGGAHAGDRLILTKSAGIEGTAILASDMEKELRKAVDEKLLLNAKNFFDKISVVRDALTAFKTGVVHAMHDPTEGGVAGGVHEIADASNLGFKIYEEKIPVAEETVAICRFFGIDPLYLIASGGVLIAVKQGSEDVVLSNLANNGITANVIGEFLSSSDKRLIKRKDGREEELARPECDHLWLVLERKLSEEFAEGFSRSF
ncbi:MAG: AIR synthase family protein [Candidatus Bathyarchaeia archaeon]